MYVGLCSVESHVECACSVRAGSTLEPLRPVQANAASQYVLPASLSRVAPGRLQPRFTHRRPRLKLSSLRYTCPLAHLLPQYLAQWQDGSITLYCNELRARQVPCINGRPCSRNCYQQLSSHIATCTYPASGPLICNQDCLVMKSLLGSGRPELLALTASAARANAARAAQSCRPQSRRTAAAPLERVRGIDTDILSSTPPTPAAPAAHGALI